MVRRSWLGQAGRLPLVFPTQDSALDRFERGPVSCPKLGFGHAEVLARLGAVETIEIEATNHFAVPGIPESFERCGKARGVERASDLEQLAKQFESRLEDLGGRPLPNPKPLAGSALGHALQAHHAHHLPLSRKRDALNRRKQLVSLESPFDIGEGLQVRPWTPGLHAVRDPLFGLHLVRQRSFGSSTCRIPFGSPVGAPRNAARRGNRLHYGPSDLWKRKRRKGRLRRVVRVIRTLGLEQRQVVPRPIGLR